jgi:hypothetical protein
MKNPFGNYVVQKALKLATGFHKGKLTGIIKKHLDKLRDKKLINKWKDILSSGNTLGLINMGQNFPRQDFSNNFTNSSNNSINTLNTSNSPISVRSNNSCHSPNSYNNSNSPLMNNSFNCIQFPNTGSVMNNPIYNSMNMNTNNFIHLENQRQVRSNMNSPQQQKM